MKEYLSTLNTRNKCVEEQRNTASNDVVLMVDSGNPRGHWLLGRVQEVFQTLTGKVRVVRVRTEAKIICDQSQGCGCWSYKAY